MKIRCKRIVSTAFALTLFLGIFVSGTMTSYAGLKVPNINEVSKAVSKLDPNLKVISVHSTPMPDLWEVVIEVNSNQKTIVYINLKKELLFSGSLFDINKKVNLTKTRLDDISRVKFASIPLDGDLVLGNPEARHKVVVFDDPD